jgi:branched-chain amino acid aminotransferase
MNGEFVPEQDAKISIYDSALMFGDMVFEMTRSFNKKQFKLREHLERLYASAQFVSIPLKMTIDEMEQACLETIKKNEPFFEENDEHRLMINITRGPLSLYAEVFGNKMEPMVIIADFPLKWTIAGMVPYVTNGINAVIPSQRAIPAQFLEPKVKNRSRIHYLMANVEVSKIKGENNWALLIDQDGFVAEGTGSNFFIVKKGVIITPEARNILRGISRDYIFELGKELGLPVVEKNIEPYDVATADEAFYTATPFCLLPVTRFNGETLGTGQLGTITKKLLDQWSKNVGVNIFEQILEYGKDIDSIRSNAASPYQFKK